MGASESHIKESYWREEDARRMVYNNNTMKYLTRDHCKTGKAFAPPGKPSASEISHTSLVLTWNQPKHVGSILAYTVEMCHMSDHHWLVLTYSCQSCMYHVRNLQADQIYMFRVRVENIYGISKPSVESDPVQTHTSDVEKQYHHTLETQTNCKSKPVRRRHSFNVPLEGAVVSILNHSDTVVKSSTCLKNFNTGTNSAESTFQRNCFRTSLEPCRKRSLTSLLPGSKTDSVSRMRDSYRKSNHSRSSLFTMQGVNRSANNSRSDISGSAHTSRSDVSVMTDISKSDVSSPDIMTDKRFSNTSDSQTSSSGIDECDHSTDSESGDIWEKKDQDIVKESLSDEIKLALRFNDKLNYDQSDHWVRKSQLANEDQDTCTIKSSVIDFRALRDILQSSDIIVKPNSLDYIEYNTFNGNHLHHKLSTIDDDEEEEFVRVTTI